MSEEHPHPLLAQLPLTVSPFISLPTATPLPYSYKQLPATLPPSATTSTSASQTQPTYVISAATGHSAHPDAIIASCHALQAHLQKLQDDATATIKKWEDGIRERELMEKRRVAPGWLDGEQKMLVPERVRGEGVQGEGQAQAQQSLMDVDEREVRDSGEELDRAFGGLELR